MIINYWPNRTIGADSFGTEILLHDGSSKNIADIVVGDCVITHKNRARKVNKVKKQQFSGKLIELKISHNRSLICSGNQKVYKVNNLSNDSVINRAIKNNKIDYKFVSADLINCGDVLLSSVLYAKKDSIITNGQARLLGVFAAEGNYAHNYKSLVLSFSTKERDNLVQEISQLFLAEFPEVSVSCSIIPSQPSKCSLYVNGCGKDIIDFFRKHIGEYSKQKVLSEDIVFGSDEIKKQFIIGWLEGDGHVDKSSGKIIGTTVSKQLASQIRTMLNGLKINNSLYEVYNAPSSIDERIIAGGMVYRVKIPYNEAKTFITASNKLSFNKTARNRKMYRFNDRYALNSIFDRKEINFSGTLYGLGIDDDCSFVANDTIIMDNISNIKHKNIIFLENACL
jgi:hypothetical protein